MQATKEFKPAIGKRAVYLPTRKVVLVVDQEDGTKTPNTNPVTYCQQLDGDKLIFPVPARLIPLFLSEYIVPPKKTKLPPLDTASGDVANHSDTSQT